MLYNFNKFIDDSFIEKYTKENNLYKEIINLLLKNKEKIKFISHKTNKNSTYNYFQYNDILIEFHHYSWQNIGEFDLTIDNIWFTKSYTHFDEYKKLCKYLDDIVFTEVIKIAKKEKKELEEKCINRLKNLINKLNKE